MRFDRRKSLASSRTLCALILALNALAATGCGAKPKANPWYSGPTEPLSIVAQRINANADKLTSIWARGSFEATVIDRDADRQHFINGSLTLLYRNSGDLRMVARKDLVGTILDAGLNSDRFWLIAGGDIDTMWWGMRDAMEEASLKEVPIRPDLLLEVLGVGSIDPDFTRFPAPTIRFNNDADAYMIIWNVRLPDRFVAQREVWYDRATLLPTMVVLFDEHGRIVLRARLSEHKLVRIDNAPEQDWPRIATEYRLLFPDSGSRMTIWLSDPRLRQGPVPNDASFAFPEARASQERTRRVGTR